jgi:cell volume regulation protein A
MDQLLLIGSLLIFLSFLLVPLSHKLGAPILLILLAAGMLAGEDGPGRIQFDNFPLAYMLGSVALAVILFAGGLETRIKESRSAIAPAGVLATLGVIITAVLVGLIASFVLNLPLAEGLLLGAVVASTDAAATFLLIQQNRIELPARLKNTLILESGVNDPVAIFMTVVLTTVVDAGMPLTLATVGEFAPLLGQQLGLGLLIGGLAGWCVSWLTDRISLAEGLYAPMILAAGMATYAATATLGGSGFLAVYLCGLVISARVKRPINRILSFHEGLQWLSQICLFLLLGLLVTPSALLDTLAPALLIAAGLMFIARPAAVFLSAGPFRFTLRETTFLSWVGLRGAVPIFLAIIPVITPGPVNTSFFNVVFIIVVTSLVLQGWTIAASARWLGLTADAPRDGMGGTDDTAPPA